MLVDPGRSYRTRSWNMFKYPVKMMARMLTNKDIEFLRQSHFLSKDLTIYLKSMLNIDEHPVPFSPSKTFGIRHRLKKKIIAARIFLEACKEAELFPSLEQDAIFKVRGDLRNIDILLEFFHCKLEIPLQELKERSGREIFWLEGAEKNL